MTTQPSQSHRGIGVIGTINEAFPVVPVFEANATILNFGQRIGISLLTGSNRIAIQIAFLLLRVQPRPSFSSNAEAIRRFIISSRARTAYAALQHRTI
jgi:hypothetical protein